MSCERASDRYALPLELSVFQAVRMAGFDVALPQVRDVFDLTWLTILSIIGQAWLPEHSFTAAAHLARRAVHEEGKSGVWYQRLAAQPDTRAGRTTPGLQAVVHALQQELGYSADQRGGVALFCDLHTGRLARGTTHPFIGSRCIASAGAHEEALEAAPLLIVDTFRSLATRWPHATVDDHVSIEQRMIAEAVDYGAQRSAEGFQLAQAAQPEPI